MTQAQTKTQAKPKKPLLKKWVSGRNSAQSSDTAGKGSRTKSGQDADQPRRSAFAALYRKELTDSFSSFRVYLLFCLMIVLTAASLSGAIPNLGDEATSGGSTEFMFVKLFTTSGDTIYSFATFIAFLIPIIGIVLGFDAITSEKSQGTLIRLASQPIYRDSIINAKFLSGATVIATLITTMVLMECGVGIFRTGLHPSGEEVARIIVFTVFSIVYCCLWMGIAIFFSTISKHASTAAIVSLALWLFLTLFMSLVAAGIANMVYPLTGMGAYYNQLNNYNLQLSLNRISPYYLFTEAATTILNPSVRSIGVVTQSQAVGALSGYLSFSQSLLLVWPELVAMVAEALIMFALAYICFMKQEIRA